MKNFIAVIIILHVDTNKLFYENTLILKRIRGDYIGSCRNNKRKFWGRVHEQHRTCSAWFLGTEVRTVYGIDAEVSWTCRESQVWREIQVLLSWYVKEPQSCNDGSSGSNGSAYVPVFQRRSGSCKTWRRRSDNRGDHSQSWRTLLLVVKTRKRKT